MASVFTKIVIGEIPSYKIAESDECFAFLDINPLAKGHVLVIPKKEIDYIFDLDDELYLTLFDFAKKVGKAIESVISCKRIGMIDHDGSASPDRVYKYYSMLMDKFDNPHKHIVHFHTTRGWGLANVLAALQAGMTNYESTLGGIGGQPANFVDGVPVSGTGEYYYKDSHNVGLVSTEDMVVMMDEMGIKTNLDIDRILETGRMVERIVGRRLRSETIHQGRIPKEMSGRDWD